VQIGDPASLGIILRAGGNVLLKNERARDCPDQRRVHIGQGLGNCDPAELALWHERLEYFDAPQITLTCG
jgi:hypothetical protein